VSFEDLYLTGKFYLGLYGFSLVTGFLCDSFLLFVLINFTFAYAYKSELINEKLGFVCKSVESVVNKIEAIIPKYKD
jgi:hypothetical protein